MQTLENERPIVYLYRLVELGVDETAVGLKNALIQVFQKDGIESHMKEKLVGFGSDGAAVNTGNISGLAIQLSKFAGRKLYSVHCMPHRMELAVSKSMKDNTFFQQLTTKVNST